MSEQLRVISSHIEETFGRVGKVEDRLERIEAKIDQLLELLKPREPEPHGESPRGNTETMSPEQLERIQQKWWNKISDKTITGKLSPYLGASIDPKHIGLDCHGELLVKPDDSYSFQASDCSPMQSIDIAELFPESEHESKDLQPGWYEIKSVSPESPLTSSAPRSPESSPPKSRPV